MASDLVARCDEHYALANDAREGGAARLLSFASIGQLWPAIRALCGHEIVRECDDLRSKVIELRADVTTLEERLKFEERSYETLSKRTAKLHVFIRSLLREADRNWPDDDLPFKRACRDALGGHDDSLV